MGWLRRFANAWVNVLNALGLLYGLVIIGYIAARVLIGEQWVLVEVANSLMPPILFPAVLFLLFALLTRRWKILPVYLPALLLFIILYAPFFAPSSVEAADETDPLRVLTFNVASWTGDTAQIASIVQSVDPDIVGFQEFLTPAADSLIAELTDRYPYHAVHPTNTFAIGMGFFSKYPIVDDMLFEDLDLGGHRLRLTLPDDRQITIFNVHPSPPQFIRGFDSSVRSGHIDEVLEVAAQESGPVLLIGDFNITDQTEDYARIAAQYEDAFYNTGTGLGPTFPNLARIPQSRFVPPLLRIDFVFYSEHWTALNSRVLPGIEQIDHYPLFAELSLKDS